MFRDSNKIKKKNTFLDAENIKRRRRLQNTTKLIEHKKTKFSERYDFILESSSDTNKCEPHDHITRLTIRLTTNSESQNRSNRSVT